MTSPIKGAPDMAVQTVAERPAGPLVIPTARAMEAELVEGLNVYPIGSLADAVRFRSGQER
jgi:magnesium chelatase family protein